MFVSYAQNFEDVMLFRALGHVDPGFYVDVGAQHPVTHSVTRAFYERGWRGINVDPVQRWVDLLREDRPEDTTLQVALGAEVGEQLFYEIANTGLSTTDPAIAAGHAEKGYPSVTTMVKVRRLDDVLNQYGLGEIHFLKIDVEGAEASVLRGMAFETHRPWIVLVEATLPLSQKESFESWQDELLAHGYEFVYADGLNRYFVAKEHPELKTAFRFPPNVFDDFVLASQLELERRVSVEHENAVTHANELIPLRNEHASALAEIEQLRAIMRMHEERVAQMEQELSEQVRTSRKAASRQRDLLDRALANSRRQELRIARLAAEAASSKLLARNLGQQLSAVQGSTSWLITAPLRLTGRVVRREITAKQATRLVAGKLLLRLGPRLYRYRALRAVGKFVLRFSPHAEARVRQTVGAIPPSAAKDTMTPRARLIFTTILRGR